MIPERWQEVKKMLGAALEREPAVRAAYLDQACTEPSLRREVDSLIAAHEQGENTFMDQAAAARGELRSGTKLGPYEIIALLGAGGMGEVYRARDLRLDRDVALKVLPTGLFADDAARRRFRKEELALAKLNHPHIAAIYDVGQEGGVDYLVMECVPGQSLAEQLKSGAFPQKEVISLGAQIADALGEAHDHGIVHRDLKPGNIMVTPKGQVKVLDFGLAKLLRLTDDTTATESLTETQSIAGTLPYMAPEQLRGETVDGRTDLWAFGAVLYEMATGRKPFPEEMASRLIDSILHQAPVAPRFVNGRVAPELEHIIVKCLEKDPDNRYPSANDLRVDFRRLSATAPAAEVKQSASRSHTLYGAVGLAVLVLLLCAGVVLFHSAKPPIAVPSEYIQLTDFPDSATAPNLSPDGQMVTFIRGGSAFLSRGQIYVKFLPNSESVRLTNELAQKYAPVFTPDGSRVAYTQLELAGASGSWDTWTVPVLGGKPTRILPNASGLSWISNRRVLFSEIKTGYHMGIVTATEDRSERREIYFPAHERAMAHFSYLSPGGNWVLVVEMDRTAQWQQCRLVPFDGSSMGRQVGPMGKCTSAGWSPDGKWMYFGAEVAGSSHLWRQQFPRGAPQQITFGPTEEDGIAVAPNGRSLITSVGIQQSSIWIHDSAGDRQISSEGFASLPWFSQDGKRAYYLLRQNSAAPSNELWSVELGSGKTDHFLPGFSITDFDISRNEREVVFATVRDGESEIWMASLDRSSPPRQVTRGADQPAFGANGEIVFRLLGDKVNYLYQIKQDGTDRKPIYTSPILNVLTVSPDGRWVTALAPRASEGLSAETIVVPARGGAYKRICLGYCFPRWSADSKFLYVGIGVDPTKTARKTLVIPVSPGGSLSELPTGGIGSADSLVKLPGTLVIEHGLIPGPDPSTYLFEKTDLQHNLFRIPLH